MLNDRGAPPKIAGRGENLVEFFPKPSSLLGVDWCLAMNLPSGLNPCLVTA